MKEENENILAVKKLLEISELFITEDNVINKVKNPVNNMTFILLNNNFLFEGLDYDFIHEEENLNIKNYSDRMNFDDYELKKDYMEIFIQDCSEEDKKKYYYAKTGANSADELVELLIKTIKLSNKNVAFAETEDYLLSDDEFCVYSFMEDNEINFCEKNIILINIDNSCDMAEVEVNGKTIMSGNNSDFHPGCHGILLPDFRNKFDLAELFDKMFKSSGCISEIILNKDWKYE